MATIDLTFERGLPANVDAERFVLGSILLNQDNYFQVAGAVEPEDFSLEKHRRIFARMKDLYDRGEKIDRVTLANELMKQGQIESVDGFAYLVSLDEGLPAPDGISLRVVVSIIYFSFVETSTDGVDRMASGRVFRLVRSFRTHSFNWL